MMKKRLFPILALLLMAATGATAQTTYTVTVKNGTEDAARWSATPNPAGEGQTVTVKYNGKTETLFTDAEGYAELKDVPLGTQVEARAKK